MTTLLIFMTIYLIASYLSKYTLLSNYEWYNDLSIKLYEYSGKYKALLQRLYYFKLFTCQSCNVFWIALAISFAISFGVVYPFVELSLITFLLHKSETNV